MTAIPCCACGGSGEVVIGPDCGHNAPCPCAPDVVTCAACSGLGVERCLHCPRAATTWLEDEDGAYAACDACAREATHA